jgi:UDP-N-acetylglucosamine 2-epimerase (non-hydrolysing)
LRENVPAKSIAVTGNTVIDALHLAAAMPYAPATDPLTAISAEKKIILVTAHRRENFGTPLKNVFTALLRLAETYRATHQIVYPVHLNPNVQEPARRMLGDVPNITLLPPLDYLPFVQLMKRCQLVLTDSGGIQEEAPGLGKPVLVLRDTTERPEGVDAGTVKLVGTQTDTIVTAARALLDNPNAYRTMAQARNPYGDGTAAQKIVSALLATQRPPPHA